MANTISNYHELPSSSTSAGQSTKGPPSPAEAGSWEYMDDDVCYRVFVHVGFSLFLLCMFGLTVGEVWRDSWHDVMIAAIAFLYSIVMINLAAIRLKDSRRRKREQEASGRITPAGTGLQAMLTSMLMLVATGIGIISLVAAVFVFRPEWHYLGFVAWMASVSTFMILFLLGWPGEVKRKKLLRADCDASDRV